MPYYKRSYRRKNYTNRRRYRKRNMNKTIKKVIEKQHPVNYRDVTYGGNYVKTTPSIHSLGDYIKDYIDLADLFDNAPAVYDQQNNETIRKVRINLIGVAFQYRYQQNDSATEVFSDTVRMLMYKHNDTFDEDNNALMSGSDIDQPPNTINVNKIFMDRIFHLRAGLTETSTDDNQFVPGTKIIKGYKKLNEYMTFQHQQTDDITTYTEGGDIRFEHASDDNSVVGEVELYGYLRIYFRILD